MTAFFCTTFVCVCFACVCLCCIHLNIGLPLEKKILFLRFILATIRYRFNKVTTIDFPNIPGIDLADNLTSDECDSFWKVYLGAGRQDCALLQPLYWHMKKLQGAVALRRKSMSYTFLCHCCVYFVNTQNTQSYNTHPHTIDKPKSLRQLRRNRRFICSSDDSDDNDDDENEYHDYICREIAIENGKYPDGSKPKLFGKREPRLTRAKLDNAIYDAKKDQKLIEVPTPSQKNSNAMPNVSVMFYVLLLCVCVSCK